MRPLKCKTHVADTPEEIDELCDEFNKIALVHFTTPVPRFDGKYERLQLYEELVGEKKNYRSGGGYKEKKFISCPVCGKPIMYSHFKTCKHCGYEVKESDILK